MTKLNYKKINELCDELFEIQNTQSKLEQVFSKFDPYFTSEDKQNLGSFLEENKRIIEEIKSILKLATNKQETANTTPSEPDLFTQNQAEQKQEPQNDEENNEE